jgi:CubicO group peptidase (beta-lactamase class C family)
MDSTGNHRKLETFRAEFNNKWIRPGRMRGATVVMMTGEDVFFHETFGNNNDQSMYSLFSLTKIFTTVAVLQQQDRGSLSIDDPVCKYLPSFSKLKVSDDMGTENTREISGEELTLRHCLNHTSGHSYHRMAQSHMVPLEKQEMKHAKECAKQNGLDGFVDNFMATTPLMFQPGTHFTYGDAHSIIARVVEVVSGETFADYMKKNITDPCNMHQTAFALESAARAHFPPMTIYLRKSGPVHNLFFACCCCWPCLCACDCTHSCDCRHMKGSQDPNRADGLPYDAGGLLLPLTRQVPQAVRGDLGLKSTAVDLIRFNQMLLNGGVSNQAGSSSWEGNVGSRSGGRATVAGSDNLNAPPILTAVARAAKIGVGNTVGAPVSSLTAPLAPIPSKMRVLSPDAVQQMTRSSLPPGAGLHAPFALGAKVETEAHSFFGLELKEFKPHRVGNSYPGQSFGLGVAIVEDAACAGLHPEAKGTCWWQGIASTFFAFNPETKIGCMVLSQTMICLSNQEALADAINAAHAHVAGQGRSVPVDSQPRKI